MTSQPPPQPPAQPPPPESASSRPPPRRDPLADVIERLRGAGLDPDLGELSDALWLARWSQPTGAGAEPGEWADGPRPRDRATRADGAATAERPPTADGGPEPADDTGSESGRSGGRSPGGSVALYPAERDRTAGGGEGSVLPGNAISIGVPEAPALPGLLELQRALRPLQRYHSAAPPIRSELDEAATAETSARAGGLLMPVFRSVSRGDASLQLLMDASSSMYVWERMLGELQQVFGQLGAFRDVHVQYLHQSPDGSAAVSRRVEPGTAALRSADQLSDPTGRQVTVLVSDCAGPLWRSGRAHRLLHRLSRYAPVAVLQPLPQRLWSRTRLPTSYGLLMRGQGPGQSAALHFEGEGVMERPGMAPIPVLPPTAAALGAWARLLSGTGTGPVPAAVGWVRADQPAAPPSRPRRPMAPAELVARFRSAASPGAAQLAVYVAAAPLYLPVMQLVQRTMLPDSGPAELSEVLLSGLLTRAGSGGSNGPGTETPAYGTVVETPPYGTVIGEVPAARPPAQWYEFAAGVQDVLLGPLGRDEALLVLKHCSEYVEQRFGLGGPNFPALAIAQLADDRGGAAQGRMPLPDGGAEDSARRAAQPFAQVAAKVLERFIPLTDVAEQVVGTPGSGALRSEAALERARALVARFEAGGMVQSLLDAVQLLRRAAAAGLPTEADPELWSELAQDLLRLWRLQGGALLLREAQAAAETAAAAPGAVRARAMLARVLHAAASDLRALGQRQAALDLLRRADREFTAAGAAMDLEPDETLRITLERAEVLEEQWRLSGDTGPLEETIGMLEAFSDGSPWTGGDTPQPAGLSLARGRALLMLAGTADDAERSRVHAGQAAESLEFARAAMVAEQAPIEDRVRVQLLLTDALLLAGDRLDQAGRLVARTLEDVREQSLRAEVLVRSARLWVRRYEAGGPPSDLEEAADRFEEAGRLMLRDRPEYGQLMEEWGAVLLRRAGLVGGATVISRAIRVLRDCRMHSPAGHPRLTHRLMMLGRALLLRYRTRQDLLDLRDAEHIFGLAARNGGPPLERARAWLALGEVRHVNGPDRLDQAADAFRRAAETARAAEDGLSDPAPAVRLAAEAHHWRGQVYESAQRPRAAKEAYRGAQEEWRRLPDGGGRDAEWTAERLAALAGGR
ncbi:SAV_2336 N-terminal domain-related protein [Streptomyces sp. H39-S7]|uniref:SAV_2336 N-terminal domain-related protein n=1 Tax=Streptomyces sp. H39-S7 TaxID=3004357 RepID=UPI0022B026DD|nr:SAV_2336 N-terminal domain-related protein [Streptomyces sp. H39-S7]MCZ4123275.1 SAV_2336 N-terminal domain-related protein [Streptomyces sp. H39-S7]